VPGELERLAETSDRDRRERLEQLQAELRTARLDLAHVDESAARRLAEVQAALDAAKARKAAALARAKRLEREESDGQDRLESLHRQLDEARVLAQGARNRGYREWRTPKSILQGAVFLALSIALFAVVFVLPDRGLTGIGFLVWFAALAALVLMPVAQSWYRRRR
jgi:Flp pilus assembly protein TadB